MAHTSLPLPLPYSSVSPPPAAGAPVHTLIIDTENPPPPLFGAAKDMLRCSARGGIFLGGERAGHGGRAAAFSSSVRLRAGVYPLIGDVQSGSGAAGFAARNVRCRSRGAWNCRRSAGAGARPSLRRAASDIA